MNKTITFGIYRVWIFTNFSDFLLFVFSTIDRGRLTIDTAFIVAIGVLIYVHCIIQVKIIFMVLSEYSAKSHQHKQT